MTFFRVFFPQNLSAVTCLLPGICIAMKGSIFISAGTLGVFGFVFSDFGKAFSVRDLNGEAPTSRIITDVSPSFMCRNLFISFYSMSFIHLLLHLLHLLRSFRCFVSFFSSYGVKWYTKVDQL